MVLTLPFQRRGNLDMLARHAQPPSGSRSDGMVGRAGFARRTWGDAHIAVTYGTAAFHHDNLRAVCAFLAAFLQAAPVRTMI
jgi:hypothetical protein